MLRAYDRALGRSRRGSSLAVPPALLAVLTRRSYLSRHSMPPGGVLLHQGLSWERIAWAGEEITGQAVVLDRSEDHGRRAVTLRSVLRTARGELLATATVKIGWPERA
ncbi:MAG TPA: MaoC family dehydratase [Solirubrobacterales bacterium]|nr:MaoC family dehydratase [Solirubrobacterales bacterium]